jgi:hypothetical protein
VTGAQLGIKKERASCEGKNKEIKGVMPSEEISSKVEVTLEGTIIHEAKREVVRVSFWEQRPLLIVMLLTFL